MIGLPNGRFQSRGVFWIASVDLQLPGEMGRCRGAIICQLGLPYTRLARSVKYSGLQRWLHVECMAGLFK